MESVERIIAAPPETIFALLADPSRHRDIDGSSTVRDARMRAERLQLGTRFAMGMRAGLPYTMVNTVIEFEPDRVIAWQTRAGGFLGRWIGGRIWRYELEAVPGGTRVRESWDISQEKATSRWAAKRLAAVNRRGMAATLKRIEELVTD